MLKAEHPINYVKRHRIISKLSKSSAEVPWQYEPLRFKRSNDYPKLPENFKIVEAFGNGDCFFDAVAQGLNQLMPQMDVTVKSLRKTCKDLAVGNQHLKNKILTDARNNHDTNIKLPDINISDNDIWNAYLDRIEYDRNDINIIQNINPSLYQSLTSLDYGSTLQVPIWGRPEIEGQIICQKFNIKLHIIEKSVTHGLWLDQIIDEKGSRSVGDVDYNDVNTIHIINQSNDHFQPVLRIQNIQPEIEEPSPDYQDEITPEEELFNVIKSNDSEEGKIKILERLFQERRNLNVNFQKQNGDTSLHLAVRKREKQIIDFLIQKRAKINDIKNKYGRTPLDVARHRKFEDVVHLLEYHIHLDQQVHQAEDQSVNEQGISTADSKEAKHDGNLKRRPSGELQEFEEVKRLHVEDTNFDTNNQERNRDQQDSNDQFTFINIPKLGSDIQSQSLPTATNRVVKWLGQPGWYTKDQIQTNSNLLFLFGDNENAKYRQNNDHNPHGAGQAAVTRPKGSRPYDRLPQDGGLNGNAIGITTTFYGGYTPTVDQFQVLMDKEFEPIETWVIKGGCLVVPCKVNGEHNLGTGIAALGSKYLDYIQHKIDELVRLGKRKPQNIPNLDKMKEELHQTLSKERVNFRSLGALQNYLSVNQHSVEESQKRTSTDSEESKLIETNSQNSREKVHGLNQPEYDEPPSEKRLRVSIDRLGGGKYAASGLKSSLHGTVYQLKLLMLFLKRGLNLNYSFRLATEMDAAEKFDDLVFKCENETRDKVVYRFLQAKHKQDESRKITLNDLVMKRDNEFSLQKYFISFRKINQNPEFTDKNIELKDFVICTNIDVDEQLQNGFNLIESEDRILDMKYNDKKSKRLKLDKDNFPDRDKLYSVLKGTSDANRLARNLAEYVSSGKSLDLKDELFKSYHGALAEKVIDVQSFKFRSSFLNRDVNDQDLEMFRSAFLDYLAKFKKQQDVDTLLQAISPTNLQLSKNFGKVFKANISLEFKNNELEKFVDAIVEAVNRVQNGIVKIERERGKRKGIIKDNIDKLAGHVLVRREDNGKDIYYFSSTFLDETNQLPSDLDSFRSKLLAKLRSQGVNVDKDTYKFQIPNFLTCTEEQMKVEPALPNDYVTNQEIESFFHKLVFAVNQPNEIELTKIIEDELGEEFNSIESQSVYSMFQTEMLNWMKEREGRFFTHEEGEMFFEQVKQSLAKLELTSLALEYSDLIERLGIEFTERLQVLGSFLVSIDKQILNIISTKETKLGSIKVYQILKNIPEYRQYENYIFVPLSSLLGQRIREHVLKAFELKTCNLLVIECNEVVAEDVRTLYEGLSKILRESEKKKVILISDSRNHLADKFKDDFSTTNKYQETIDGPNNLSALSDKSQDKILKEGKAIFQGKEVSLGTLINNDDLKYLIDEQVLAQIVRNENIEIGKVPLSLGDIKYYFIDRVFSRQVEIKKEYFTSINTQDLVAVSNIGINELSRLANGERVRSVGSSDPDSQHPVRFVVLDSSEPVQKSFTQLCKHYKRYNIHWIKKEDGKFIWQQSYGALTHLRNFIGSNSITECKGNKITSILDRLVILSAEPGMGKSTVLTKLVQKTKKYDDSLLIVRVNLNDHSKHLEKVNFSANREEAINFLFGVADLKSPLEQELFRHRINIQGKIALLFDGFDEITPTYKDKVMELFNILKETKVEKLWVTTRPHMRNELEDRLSMLSHTLKPLSGEDQKQFLKRFWSKKLGFVFNEDDNRLNNYVEGILGVLSNSVVDKEVEFTGIPLQTRMLAEAFESEFKDFYNSGEDRPKLPKKLDLVDLYQMFVKKKYDIYCEEKKKEDLSIPSVKRDNKILYETFLLRHKLLALSAIFSNNDLEALLSQGQRDQVAALKSDIQEGEKRSGIVNQLINEEPKFIHRTFAEYFAASWFVDEAIKLLQDNTKKVFDSATGNMLRKKLFETENEVLRNFFDRMLVKKGQDENKYGFHNAALNNDEVKMNELLRDPQRVRDLNSVDNGGRTALHLAASYAYSDIVQIVLEHGADIGIKDNIFGWTPLSYADRSNHWGIAEILLKSGANGKDMFEAIGETRKDVNTHDRRTTLLHVAAEKGLNEFAKVLVENGADIKRAGPNDKNAFHIAAENGNLNIVEYFVKTDPSSLHIKDTHYDMSPLHFASKEGNLDVVKYIVENGGNAQEVADDGKTALHFAANTDNLDLVKYLVQSGCNVNIQDRGGLIPLHYATASGNLNAVKYLVDETSSNVNLLDNNGNTVVHFAARSGNLDLVKYLVNDKEMDFNAKDNNGKTPLHRAAQFDNLDVIKFLMNEKGADVNIPDKYGMTPLHFATISGHLNIVKYLIDETEFDVDLGHKDGITLVQLASDSGNSDLVKYLHDKEMDFNVIDVNGSSLLHYAAEEGQLVMVKFLLTVKGADVNLQDNNGMTALHLAASHGFLNIVKYLIDEANANIHLVDGDGTTLVQFAAGGKLDVMKYLVDSKKMDFNTKDANGRTPLHNAAKYDKLEIVKFLVNEKEVEVDIKDIYGMTSLHFAAASGNLDVVKYLINETNTNVHLTDENGASVVHFAAESRDSDVIKYLIDEKGMEVDVKDNIGKTVLHYAAQKGRKHIVKYLLNEKNFDVNIQTYDGQTPLHFAAASGQLEFVKYLINKTKANLDLVDEDDVTLLHFAVESGNLDLVKYLVDEKEMDLNSRTKHGLTPLDWAAENGNLLIVKYFLNEKSVDVNSKTSSGETVIHFAASSGDLDLIKYLLERKRVDINTRNNDESTALNFAIENGHLDVIKYLVLKGAEISVGNKYFTVLHQAVSSNNKEIIYFILKSVKEKSKNLESDINVKDSEGNTPLMLAVENGNLTAVKMLLRYNADVNIQNNDGETALLWAVKSGYKKTVKVLLDNEANRNIKDKDGKTPLNFAEEQLVQDTNNDKFKTIRRLLISEEADDEEPTSSSLTLEDCLPNVNHHRSRRNAQTECLFSWQDVDEFSVQDNEGRSLNKIKINSEKFINYIKEHTDEKRRQLIGLAEQVETIGNSKGLVYKLINNAKVMNHLNKVGKFSSMTMHGMIGKNVLSDFLNGDYQGVAINIGFIAGGHGFSRVAEAASLKGMKSISEGKVLLGKSLRAAVPFLARGTSAFVVYDLVNQARHFKNGTTEAVIGLAGDSIYLGVDAAAIGIEIAEAFDVLQGVSTVTGPIGAAVGAVVFIGTDIFRAVKAVDKIDEFIHLTGKEKFIEGLRAFIGMKPEQYVQKLTAEKQLNNQLVKQGLQYLNQHGDIRRYIFPTGKLVEDSCQRVPYKTSVCVSGGLGGRCFRTRTATRYSKKCTTKFRVDLDNRALLERKRTDIKWSRTKPYDPNGGEVFCSPVGDYEPVPREGSYLCEKTIGIADLSTSKSGNYTFIDLGEGLDYAEGFVDSPNIFVVHNGSKRYFGGNKDDIFILQGSYVTGYFYGKSGINTLDLTSFAPEEESLEAQLHLGRMENYYRSILFGISDINRFLGRKRKSDQIFVACDSDANDIRFLDGQGGSESLYDYLRIYEKDCVYDMQLVVRPNTVIHNHALKGNFHYMVPYARGTAKIDFIYTAEVLDINNTFIFEYGPTEIENVDVKVMNVLNKTSHIIAFNLSSLPDKQLNVTISGASNPSYRLGNTTELKVGSKGNLYFLQKSNQSVDEIIMSYLPVVSRLRKTSFFIHSLLSNEWVAIGSGNHEIIHNNPQYKSHLFGNGGENVYVIHSGLGTILNSETLPIPEVVIYNLDTESSVDTIDLRYLMEYSRMMSPNKDNFKLAVFEYGSDLLLKATITEVETTGESSTMNVKAHEYFTVRLNNGVNYFNKTHVIVDGNVPMRISLDEGNAWTLKPQPLVFEADKELIVVTSQDIERNSELFTPRRAGNYTFARNADDLLVTNVFDVNITENSFCTIVLSSYYTTPKMETLSIKFADEEVILQEHEKQIRSAIDLDIMKAEYKEHTYHDVFNRTGSGSENIVSPNQPLAHKQKHERSKHTTNKTRHRRSNTVTSGGSTPFSLVNYLIGWIRRSIGGLLNSKPALREEISNTGHIVSLGCTPIDVDGTLILLDLLIRRFTGQKYNFAIPDMQISLLEAQVCAIKITERFHRLLNETAIKSGISVGNINFDPVAIQSALIKLIRMGRVSQIPKTLYSLIDQAWPEFSQSCKFQGNLRKHLKDIVENEESFSVQLEEQQICINQICTNSGKLIAKTLCGNPKSSSISKNISLVC